MGHRGYTNRAKGGDRASVARLRQQAARAALAKQREEIRRKDVSPRPKPTIVLEPGETEVSGEEDRNQDDRGS